MRYLFLLLAFTFTAPVAFAVEFWTDIGHREWAPDAEPNKYVGKTVDLIVPRNGQAAGQVVVKADGGAITKVNAVVSPLKNAGVEINDATVRVRYVSNRMPLERNKPSTEAKTVIYDDFVADGDALAVVYVSVHAGIDTKPGKYTGEVTVTSSAGRVSVPMSVEVVDYVMPARSELDFWMALGHSPTHLAYYYKVPHYGEKHWQYIEQSLRLLGQTGHRVTYVPVLWHSNAGTGHQLITFKKEGGQLVPDLSKLRRYLELVKKHCGEQELIVLGVWGRWMLPLNPRKKGDQTPPGEAFVTLETKPGVYEPFNINADGDAKKPYGYTEHEAMWKAVYDGVAKVAAETVGVPPERIILGNADDRHPRDEQDAFWQKIAPKSPGWDAWTHNYGKTGPRPAYFQVVDTRPPDTLAEIMLGAGRMQIHPGAKNSPQIVISSCRDFQHSNSPAWLYTTLPFVATGRHPRGHSVGVSRVGLDYWHGAEIKLEDGTVVNTNNYSGAGAIKVNRTRPGRVVRNYRGHLTAPGPDGAVPILHFEALLEGIQINQARLEAIKAIHAEKGNTDAMTKALELQLTQGVRTIYTRMDKHRPEFKGLDNEKFDTQFFRAFGQSENLAGWGPLYRAAADAQKALGRQADAIKSAKAEKARQAE